MTDQYCQLLGHKKDKEGKCLRCGMWIDSANKEHLLKP